MVVEPMIRSNMCVNAHPQGCAMDVKRQIEYVQKKRAERGTPKDALWTC